MNEQPPITPRSSVRIPTTFTAPEPLEDEKNEGVAYIDTQLEGDAFNPEGMGLIYDTSYVGCGIVLVARPGTEKFQPGMRVKLKVGILNPIKATIRWRRELEEKFFTLGFEYNE